MSRRLILASSSEGRRSLVARLRLPFEAIPAHVDESPLPGEAPEPLALRLSLAKARAVAALHPGALVIGSDQVGVCRGRVLEKPGSMSKAEEQLQWMQGDTSFFYSGVCVLDALSGQQWLSVESCEVQLRALTAREIAAYVALERPLASAGSFLAESLGPALFERVAAHDPTTLLGLPLIRLCAFLREAGMDPLAPA